MRNLYTILPLITCLYLLSGTITPDSKEGDLKAFVTGDSEVRDLKNKGFIIRSEDQFTYVDHTFKKVWEKKFKAVGNERVYVTNSLDHIFIVQLNKKVNEPGKELALLRLDYNGEITDIRTIQLNPEIDHILTLSYKDGAISYLAKCKKLNVDKFLQGTVDLHNYSHTSRPIDITAAKQIEYLELMKE